MGFPCGLVIKNLPANARASRDKSSIPGSGRLPGGGNDNPLHYSRLENFTDPGAWWATVHGVTRSWTRLSTCGVLWYIVFPCYPCSASSFIYNYIYWVLFFLASQDKDLSFIFLKTNSLFLYSFVLFFQSLFHLLLFWAFFFLSANLGVDLF